MTRSPIPTPKYTLYGIIAGFIAGTFVAAIAYQLTVPYHGQDVSEYVVAFNTNATPAWSYFLIWLLFVLFGWVFGRAYDANERRVRSLLERINHLQDELHGKERAESDRIEQLVAQRTHDRITGIEEAKREYQDIVDNAEDAFVKFDTFGILTYANPALARITGYELDELRKSHYERFLASVSLPLFSEAFHGCLKNHRIINFQFQVQRKSGRLLKAEMSANPITEGEHIIGIRGIVRDITERDAIERMKSEFVTIASHQLRTPLSAIKWFLEPVVRSKERTLDAKKREFVEHAYDSAKRMALLVNDLLDVSRIESGSVPLKFQKTDIRSLLTTVADEMKVLAENRGITFRLQRIPTLLPTLHVDSIKLKQVIQNVVTNAINYNREHGSVTLAVKHTAHHVQIDCADTGIGISGLDQKKLFTKFFRSDHVLHRETVGSGLGLYYAKQVIDAHGGTIWFESEQGVGTTFHIQLPLVQHGERTRR